MVHKRRKSNPTVMKMATGVMRFKRRVDIPMWHVDHIQKTANILREYADRIESTLSSNSMRNSDKTLAVQYMIQSMNNDMARMTPKDPRERGAERGGYNHDYGRGYINTNGFDELLARDDMDD